MRFSQSGKTSREITQDKYAPPVQIFRALVLLSKTGSVQPVLRSVFSRQTSVHSWQIGAITAAFTSPQFVVG